MNRKITFAALFCAISAPAMAQGFSLDVVSFNLRNGTADGGENSWRLRKDWVNERDVLADPSPERRPIENPRPSAMRPSQNQNPDQTFTLLRN